MPSIADPDFGDLVWNPELDWWEGSVKLDSPQPFVLYLFSRDDPDRQITAEARNAFRRVAGMEGTARAYAALQLTASYNREWSDGKIVTEPEFARRLIPASIEIHEQGYAELHFQDGGLFSGHGVGVRIKPDGSFQEAVMEG
jgi:hypothetical protein